MKTLLLFAALCVGAASAVQAQSIPTIVSYQGYITNNGVPIDGPEQVTLALYSNPGLTNLVWSLPSQSVTVSKGYYTILMDFSKNWTNGTVDFHGQFWLQVTVGNQVMGSVQMTGSPFAINAILADSAIHVPQAPIGTIVAYAGQALNLSAEKATGWYVCNGDSIPVASYPTYASAIDSIYGTSADGNYVYLPDLRGLFLRGVSDGRTDSLKDPDASTRFALNGHGLGQNQVGSVQNDDVKSHDHPMAVAVPVVQPPDSPIQPCPNGVGSAFFGFQNTTTSSSVYKTVIGFSTGHESRPKNAYVYWLIKVK